MREPQKVEGFGSPHPSFPAPTCGVSTELDETGLVGVYIQLEVVESLLHGSQEALRVPLVLKTHHEVISVPHDDCVAFGLVAAPLLLEPQVENVVQVDVRPESVKPPTLGAFPADCPATLQLP